MSEGENEKLNSVGEFLNSLPGLNVGYSNFGELFLNS